MADRLIASWSPTDVECKTTVFPQPSRSSDASGARPILLFDAALDEAGYFPFVAPPGITTPLKMIARVAMVSATSGNVVVDGAIEAITSADTLDTDASEGLDSVNISSATAVPGTAGYSMDIIVTLTNNDSIAAGDLCRLRFRRPAQTEAGDTAAGDLVLLGLWLYDNGL